MTTSAPAAPPSAPPRKPERESRNPFRSVGLIFPALVGLMFIVGVPTRIVMGIGLIAPVSIVAIGFAKGGHYTRPVFRQVAADDTSIPAEVAWTFSGAERELDALGFEGMTVFHPATEAPASWMLLATHPVKLDAAQVACFMRNGRIFRTVVNYSTRLAGGMRKVTYGGGGVSVGRSPATIDALRLPTTTGVYHVYAVHRWRLGGTGPPQPSVDVAVRITAAYEEMEADAVARGTWRRNADGTMRRTWKGTLAMVAGLLAIPVKDWRDRRRERRILVQAAEDPAR